MSKKSRNNGKVTELPIEHRVNLKTIKPKTKNQAKVFDFYNEGKHIFAHGISGTGKTYIALYLALKDVVINKKYDKICIVRSAVPTRDMGFLPGSAKEKAAVYEAPYEFITSDLVQLPNGYNFLKSHDKISFIPTSYIRGLTIENTIIIIDEAQNMSFHECDSLLTRLGENSRLIFCGDFRQTDLTNEKEKEGFHKFMKILQTMPSVGFVEFEVSDVVRSNFVKEYIIAKDNYQKANSGQESITTTP